MSSQSNALLSIGEVCERLGVGRSQLQNLFDLIPHLYVWKRETRFFPAPYIDAYAAYLRTHRLRATKATARAFWGTDDAKRHTQEAQQRVDEPLRTKTAFTATELMALLCVARMTITSWYQGGVFKVARQRKPPKMVLVVPASEMRRALQWKLPAG